MSCPICAWSPENRDYLLIHETGSWRVCLAPNQSLIGRCVINLKRHAGGLADLTEDEWGDFLNVVRRLESALRSAFNASMFNWSSYMNHAYRENPPDPHVHWWAVPRYARALRFGGRTFEDPHFGNPYDHSRSLDLPETLRAEIAGKIRETYA